MKNVMDVPVMNASFDSVLVANRGEIALRIMRTARQQGLRVIAVYSEADRNSPHVTYADEAVCLGSSAAAESYRSIPKIIAAAKASGATAIHPGYGFLAENAEFAEAVVAQGLVFVGPSAQAIRLMGNKAQAKDIMIAAGVPCIPGYQGAAQDDKTLIGQAARIGFPLMVKAAAGGGGRGMRLVRDQRDVLTALQSARSEALASFGSDQLILERAILNARHVEVQIFGDQMGNVIHLGERDCSVQRRHQKLIEESPSPAVDAALRSRMGATAVAAGQAIQYVGAGTLEFLLGDDGNFWFMEMNTRLQVEHGVTELVTGLDLVAWQLKVAMGQPLPLAQEDITWSGHAMEVRLCAEDTTSGFLPQTGRVLAWDPSTTARTDAALYAGLEVSAFYDSMLAKIMVQGDTREICINKLLNACHQTVLLGLRHNLPFLQTCLAHQRFKEGHATTTFIDECFDDEVMARRQTPQVVEVAAAVLLTRAATGGSWTNALGLNHVTKVAFDGLPARLWSVDATSVAGQVRLSVDRNEEVVSLMHVDQTPSLLTFDLNGKRHQVRFAVASQGQCWLQHAGAFYCATDLTHVHEAKDAGVSANAGVVRAPLAGRVAQVPVLVGQHLKAGDPLIVIESMKMEHTLFAAIDGEIQEVSCQSGDQVMAGRVLVRIKATVDGSVPKAST